jgi:hypothetical protein
MVSACSCTERCACVTLLLYYCYCCYCSRVQSQFAMLQKLASLRENLDTHGYSELAQRVQAMEGDRSIYSSVQVY